MATLPMPGTTPAPGLRIGEGVFSPQQMKDWWATTGGDPDKIAADAVTIGANADQIAQAIAWGSGKPPEYNGPSGASTPVGGSAAIKGYVNDLMPDYQWDDNGILTAKDVYSKVGMEDSQLAQLLDVSKSDLATWKGATQVTSPTIKSGSLFTAPATDAQSALPTGAFIENRLPALLDSNNAYVGTARARALQAMNNRGLLNSTMAQQAGETAAIEAALQIAGPDAATTATAYRDVLGKNLQTELNAQQGTINSQLQSEQIQGNADVTAMQESQQNVRSAFDGMVRQYIADKQLAGEEVKALSATSSEVMQQFMNKYTEVQLNEEMSADDKQLAINDLWTVSQSSLGLAASLQGVEFDFSGVSTNITSLPTTTDTTSDVNSSSSTAVTTEADSTIYM